MRSARARRVSPPTALAARPSASLLTVRLPMRPRLQAVRRRSGFRHPAGGRPPIRRYSWSMRPLMRNAMLAIALALVLLWTALAPVLRQAPADAVAAAA